MSIEFNPEPIRGPEDFGSALSVHPIPSMAVGEAVGQVLEKVGEGSDLVCLFVSALHAGALEDIAGAVHTILDPKVMIGAAAAGVIGNGQQVVGEPALVVWAGNVGDVSPIHLEMVDRPGPGGSKAISGWPINLGYVPAAAVLLADPFGFPVPGLFAQLNHAGGFPRVIGASPAAGIARGTSRLVLNGEVFTSGAVGALLKANETSPLEAMTSPGAKGFGPVFTVTSANGNTIEQLDDEPAYRNFAKTVQETLTPEDALLAERGVMIGKAITPRQPDTFAIRALLAADAWEGTMTIGEQVRVGDKVRFHLPDAEFAHQHLVTSLTATEQTTPPRGGLLFVDSVRARNFYDGDTNDAGTVADTYPMLPTAGVVGDSTFGPAQGLNALQGLSATAAFFS